MRLTIGTSAACVLCAMVAAAPALARETWYIGGTSIEQQFNNNTVHDAERIENCVPLAGCSTSIVRRDYRGDFHNDRFPQINVGFINRDGWRTEFTYDEANHGIESPQSKEDEIESKRLMVSAWRDFRRGDSPLGAYAGLGLGVGQLRQGPADDEFVMAQAGVGLTYAVTRNLTVDLGFRAYAGEPDLVLEDDDRAIDLDYRGRSLGLGIRYYFY